ncbi:FabD/lysophospholipase-like protein [Hesseltinella vesiculosa]|uniref:Lysophospholipase n=1 Tax=Hesseltinella vesiculosa TaxID=101127 RepID=A0A1X2G938_9FUNG|nr:FabD/lysophospholipase-like protein [Hesseltinella vesiculosa]
MEAKPDSSGSNGIDDIEKLAAAIQQQAFEAIQKSKASILDLEDQLLRRILGTIPLIKDAQNLTADQLRESVTKLWESFTIADLLDATTDAKDPTANPEMTMDAHVRQGSQLCDDEEEFRRMRKAYQRLAFAKFIEVDPAYVDEQDIPVVGVASSGGGYRAMIGLTGYLKGMQESGALDCVTYLAGVSGSCWGLSLFNSVLTNGDADKMIEVLKKRVTTHFASVPKVYALASASTMNAKNILQGIGQRYLQQHTVSLVDLFGMLIGTKLFTTIDKTSGEQLLEKSDMKLTSQAKFSQDGSHPMPIYCVVHQNLEKLLEEEQSLDTDEMDKAHIIAKINELIFSTPLNTSGTDYMWFEFTPYEIGSSEVDAWVPTWSFGRPFDHGVSTVRLPEQRLDVLLGVFGSAFTATVVHFYREIRGLLPTTSVNILDDTIERYQSSLATFYPISPAMYPNPFHHLDAALGTRPRPSFVTESKNLYLMDAGMDNNIPFHCYLGRRDVDVILAFDLSADISTAPHLSRAEGYVKRHGIEGWPENVRWPNKKDDLDEWIEPYGLGTCTVFPTTATTSRLKQDRHQPIEEMMNEEWVVQEKKHLTLLYYPFIVNHRFDPEFDPQTADFCATWNFVYKPEQVDRVVNLAKANWDDNVDKVRAALYAAWQRKRLLRLQQETLAAVEDPF